MTAPTDTDLLGRILTAQTFAFALVSRPESGVPGMLDVLVGDVSEVETLSDIPLAADAEGWDVLAVVPYRQLAERGFDAPDDGAPLLVMTVGSQDQVPVAAALARLPELTDRPGRRALRSRRRRLCGLGPANRRRRDRQGRGRQLCHQALLLGRHQRLHAAGRASFFRRLLQREQRAYWTFLIHAGTDPGRRDPERHVALRDGTAVMNPISGTYRYPSSGPTLSRRAGLPRRRQGDRRAVHGGRRGTEDDGPDLRRRRPGTRPVPEGDGALRTPSTSSRAAPRTRGRSCGRRCSRPRSRAARWRAPAG